MQMLGVRARKGLRGARDHAVAVGHAVAAHQGLWARQPAKRGGAGRPALEQCRPGRRALQLTACIIVISPHAVPPHPHCRWRPPWLQRACP